MSFRHGDPWPDCCFGRVAVWGAIDARQPVDANGDGIPDRPQVFLRKDYSAPLPLKAKGMVCLPARGVPRLPMLIRICRAPDGTYWTLQRFRRRMRNFGGAEDAFAKTELWPSHFTFPIAKFEDLRVDGDMISGRLTYRGRGVHGFRSTSTGEEGYGRTVYLDVLNGPYGRGWRRENRFPTQAPDGRFEYQLQNGEGDRYRVTAVGPGVTPIVREEFGP
jgi:hypothetical protein